MLLCLFFFASGFSALIYQVGWVRIFSVTFGTTVYAISTVLTIFMAGLALGSYLFGRWIDRVTRPLLVYAAIELVLGVYMVLFVAGTASIHLVSGWLLRGSEISHLYATLVKFWVAVFVLLLPTTLMGGTLPVLAKFITRSPQTIGRWLGLLYGLNTLGAVVGCLSEAYLLILVLGIRGSLLLGAAINITLGIISLVLANYVGSVRDPEMVDSQIPASTSLAAEVGRRRVLLYVVAFSSGLVTLATEVLWTRLFINFLSGNVLVFATILAAFLTGIASGSFLVARWVDRLRRLDLAIGISLLASAIFLAISVFSQEWLADVFRMIRSSGENWSQPTTVYLSFAILFVFVGLPATIFGTVLPLLFRGCSRSLLTLGRDVGKLYAANTIGSIVGSFISGFVLIWLLGVNGSLLLLAGSYSVLACWVFRKKALRLVAAVAAVFFFVLVAIPGTRQPVFWFNAGFNTVHRIPAHETLFLQEGIEATVGVAQSEKGQKALVVNGVAVAENTRRDLWDLLLKAHLPMLLHENPRRVALVGLGAGVSLGAVEAYDVDRIDCVEIAEDVVQAHQHFADINGRCWEDDRLHLWINDGRHFLQTTNNRYDVISVDPTDPPVVYQYSQNFIQLCHDRLDEGGVMVQWVPLFHLSDEHIKIIMRAFLNVFPNSTLWYDGTSVLLMGKRGGSLDINVRQMMERIKEGPVQESLSLIGNPDVWLLLSTYVCGSLALEEMIGSEIPENTDDRPYLEYAILRSRRADMATFASNLEIFIPHYKKMHDCLREVDRTPENLQKIADARALMTELFQARLERMRGHQEAYSERLKKVSREYSLGKRERWLLQPFYQMSP